MISRHAGSGWLPAAGWLLAALLTTFPSGRAWSQTYRSAGGPQPEPALRLTFEYRDGRLALLEARELTMVLPLVVKERVLRAGQSPSGYALELRDNAGKELLVEALDDPLTLVSETQDPNAPGRIVRR